MVESNTNAEGEKLMERIVSVTEKGQATIPKNFREVLGIEAPGKVKFRETSSGQVVIEPVMSARSFRGALAADDQSGTEILREDRRKEREQSEGEFSRFIDSI